MLRSISLVVLLLALAPHAPGQDRTIRKEPVYTSRPHYCLLAFGPEGKDRAWLVRDGDVLYVDRNGNGDLTDPGERIDYKMLPDQNPDKDGWRFDIDSIAVGGRTHKHLTVVFTPLKLYRDSPVGARADAKAAMARNPNVCVANIDIEVEVPSLPGGGTDGRVRYVAGFIDLNGLLMFARSPADAPVIRLGGPLQITLSDSLQPIRLERNNDIITVVGTPGIGPGTFASIAYAGTIPESARPTCEIEVSAVKPGEPPTKLLYMLPDRC
ncbi:MAG: hypothetical protein K1X57_12835 [Gemmataceae bacterium]|nr:hypothetical protein [Gemmataceae bacterium]